MTTRVMLISPARSEALEQVAFDDGRPLSAAGVRQLAAVDKVPGAGRLHVSPSPRCRQTAEELGLRGEPLEAPAGCAMGRWRGRTLGEVSEAEPEAFAGWLSDPGSAPHGGESLHAFCARIAAWLEDLANPEGTAGAAAGGAVDATGATAGEAGPGGPARPGGRVVAVVEPDVVRAAAVRALGTPLAGFWRLDVGPLTLTTLSGRDGRWNLRLGTGLAEGAHA